MANDLELSPRVAAFSTELTARKDQIREALPAHLNDGHFRAAVLNCFRSNADLQTCSQQSIIESVLAAAACGLTPINGHGYLIPYKQRCTFVPGWKGLAHLVVESGKAMVATNVAWAGDEFRPILGTVNQITHVPLTPEEEAAWFAAHSEWKAKVRPITHAYAVGRLRGFEATPIVECWSHAKLLRHRDKYNKQGAKHYSFREEEQYFRKVVLLQVIKLLPQSQQMVNALAAGIAAETGAPMEVDGGVVRVQGADDYWDADDEGGDSGAVYQAPAPAQRPQPMAKSSSQRQATAAERADPATGELRDDIAPRAALLRPVPPAPAPAAAPVVQEKPITSTGLKWLREWAFPRGVLREQEVLAQYGLQRLEDMSQADLLALRDANTRKAA
jgi:recombination protein RecT